MIEIDWKPDRAKLRQFGWIGLAGFLVIAGLLGWRFGWFESDNWVPVYVLGALAVFSGLGAAFCPAVLRPLYLAMTAISAVIGPVVAVVVMGLIFCLVFLPLGLIFRMMGRDELKRDIDPSMDSYWSQKPAPKPPERYFRQF